MKEDFENNTLQGEQFSLNTLNINNKIILLYVLLLVLVLCTV